MFSGYGVVANGVTSNECLEIESDVSLAAAAAGKSTLVNSIIACEEPAKGTLANGDPLARLGAGSQSEHERAATMRSTPATS